MKLASKLGLIAVLGVALLAGCVTQKNQFASSPVEDTQPLLPGETIEVLVNGAGCPPEPMRTTLDGRGRVGLPLIGSCEIGGLTPGEAGLHIRASYVPQYYSKLLVEVKRVQSSIHAILSQSTPAGSAAHPK